MSTKISRRKVLLGAGAAGAATMLLDGTGAASLMTVRAQEPQMESEVPESSLDLLKEHEDHTIVLEAGDMVVHFDRRYGSISSITRKSDPFATNYIGNELNTPGVNPSDSRWTGDVVATVWQLTTDKWQDFRLGQNDVFRMSGRWKRELTGRSADIRRVKAADGDHAFADDLRIRYLNAVLKSGFAENFDPQSGEGFRDPTYTWTSSVYLILAHELDMERERK
jgi:hypothetical protein